MTIIIKRLNKKEVKQRRRRKKDDNNISMKYDKNKDSNQYYNYLFLLLIASVLGKWFSKYPDWTNPNPTTSTEN